MIDRHGFCHHKAFFLSQSHGLVKFCTVEGDRLLYQNMFPVFQCLFHKFKMLIMRCRNIDNIYFRINKHFLEVRINLLNPVFLTKSFCLFICPVAYRICRSSVFLHACRHLVGNCSRSKNCPVQSFHDLSSFSFLINKTDICICSSAGKKC